MLIVLLYKFKENQKMTPPTSQANAENVIAGLNVLRNEQRGLASKLAELQMDLNEHKFVVLWVFSPILINLFNQIC